MVVSCDDGYYQSGNECLPDVSVPTAPSNLTGSAISTSEIELTWTDNADDETYFQLKRNGSLLDDNIGPNTEYYLNSGLDTDTNYQYSLQACNSAGCSEPVLEKIEISEVTSQPDSPSGLEIYNIEDDKISLIWEDESNNEDGFIIERKCGDLNFNVIANDIETNTTNYTDFPLAPGIEFSYRIKAFNQDGESDYSDIIVGTTEMTNCCEYAYFPFLCTNGCSCQESY